jgi:hypothetical protein
MGLRALLLFLSGFELVKTEPVPGLLPENLHPILGKKRMKKR